MGVQLSEVLPHPVGQITQCGSRYQADTALRRGGYMRQVTSDRIQATVRVDKRVLLATWNVNVLHQARKNEKFKRERRMGLDIIV